MEGKIHQANENRKRRMMNQSGPSNTHKYRPSSSGGFTVTTRKNPYISFSPLLVFPCRSKSSRIMHHIIHKILSNKSYFK
jgi:hypothetical protein